MLKSNEIHKLNEANIILRRFVELSARLLPLLSDLDEKKTLTYQELENKKKIAHVFDNYNFDTKTSEFLIDSNILELIRSTYSKLSNKTHGKQKKTILYQFLFEHKRLSESWQYIMSN